MGHMQRAEAREDRARFRDQFTGAVVIAAAVNAAVRLTREENVDNPTPRVNEVVRQLVALAWMK